MELSFENFDFWPPHRLQCTPLPQLHPRDCRVCWCVTWLIHVCACNILHHTHARATAGAAQTATHTLPAATHCNTRQRTSTHRNALQRTATHCNALQYTATHCNALQHTATHCNTLQHTATHCNTLQHTATHCIALQHTAHTATHWFIHTWHDPFKTILLQLHQTLSHTYTYTHIHTHTHINTYYKYITWTQLCTKETYIRTKEAHIKRHDFIYVQKRPI